MLLRYLPKRRPTYFRNRQPTAQTHFSHHRTRKSRNGRRQRGLFLRQEKLLPTFSSENHRHLRLLLFLGINFSLSSCFSERFVVVSLVSTSCLANNTVSFAHVKLHNFFYRLLSNLSSLLSLNPLQRSETACSLTSVLASLLRVCGNFLASFLPPAFFSFFC